MEGFPEKLKQYYDNIEKHQTDEYGIKEYKCVHIATKTTVLVKEISYDMTQRFFNKMFIWLDLLNHDAILRIYHVHLIDDKAYMAFEYMPSDIHAVVRAKLLEEVHIKYLMYQILRLLKYGHSANIIFRHLKGFLLGVDEECKFKLLDLTNEVTVQGDGKDDDEDRYVTNRWHRPPERLLGQKRMDQTPAYDMWSLGCVFGEMLGRIPFPGTSTMNQLDRIVEFIGMPTEQDLISVNSLFATTMMESLMVPPVLRDFKELYPTASEDALDLLKKLLQFNPNKRLTAAEALKHKYLAEFHNCLPELDSPSKITPFFNDNKTKIDPKKTLQEFIAKFRQQQIEPFMNTIILVHNIARSSSALELLPIEMWLLIFKKMHHNDNEIGMHEKIAVAVFNAYFRPDKK